jgi:hypothetical protein
MKQTDYDALIRHSVMLKNTVRILEGLREFQSVAELDAVQSVIHKLRAASSETNETLVKIEAKRERALKVQQRIDQITRVLPIPTIALVTFLGVYKNGQGVVLISFCTVLFLLLLTLVKNLAVTFKEFTAIFAIGTVFIIAIYSSELIRGFVTRYSAEISAASLLYALVLPWFTKSTNPSND